MTAALAWGVFVLLPGAALTLLIQPTLRQRLPLLLSVAPASGFVIAIVGAEVLRWTGLGPWPGVAVLDAALVMAATIRLARARGPGRPDGAEGQERPEPGPKSCAVGGPAVRQRIRFAGTACDTPRLTDSEEDPIARTRPSREAKAARWLLGIAILVGAGLWVSGARPSVPPNADSQNHGYFVARIVELNTVDPALVLTQSPVNPTPMARFYPLSIHVTVALAHQAAGIPIGDLLTTWTAMTAAVCLPCGLFALVRRLLPDRPVPAGLAALLGAAVAVFPYQPMVWGGLALVIGLSLVPGALTLCLDAVDTDRRALPAVTAAAVAVAGVSLAHTSEAALLALLLAAFGVADLVAAHRRRDLRLRLRRWLALGSGIVLLLAPWALAVATGSSERATQLSNERAPLLATAADLVTFDVGSGAAQPVMGMLTILGVLLVLRKRSLAHLRPLAVAMGVLALLFVATLVPGAPWDQLRPATIPWYRTPSRLMYNVALLSPVFAAVTIDWARRALRDRGSLNTPAVTAVVAALALVLLVPAAHRTLRFAYDSETLLGPSEVALIEDFARRFDAADGIGIGATAPDGSGAAVGQSPLGSAVLNQRHDATTWMYAIAGLPAFSGLRGYETPRDHADRRYVVEHLPDIADDPREQALLQRFDARYVMVNDDTYLDFQPDITPDELREAGFRVVDHRGSLWLFEIPT